MFFLTSSYDFFAVYLSLEGLSLTLYVMSGMLEAKNCSVEAALKYYVLSAISTGVGLFGMSILYSIVGSLGFMSVQLYLSKAVCVFQLSEIKISLVLIIFSFLFKIAAFPCHI